MGWCVGLVGGDGASARVRKGGILGVAARTDAVIVQQLVVAGAEQDEVGEVRLAVPRDGREVVGFEFARSGAAWVLAVR